MAPDTFHAVYTPVRCVAAGGHIFMNEAMHLTEVSKAFDHKHGLDVTNTSHVGAFDTITLIFLNMIRDDRLGMFNFFVQV